MGKRIDDGLDKYQRYRLKDVEGYRKRKREWARSPEQRAIRNAYMQKWREKNRARHNELGRQSHHRNKHKHVQTRANDNLLRTVGITLYEKWEMIQKQNNCCAICGEPFSSSKRTHVDHCHKTKTVRGILCQSCNTKLGWFEAFGAKILGYLKW